MSIEIERRFLLKSNEWKVFAFKKTAIEQGYLSYNLNNWITRIRFNGKNFKITLKKHIQNFTNYEFEYSIPFNDGKKIMSTLTHKIKKDRFYLDIEKKIWIIDCFKDENFPLEIAEIELQNETEKLDLPNFLSKEITGLKIFSNYNLAISPFRKWNKKDLRFLKDN